MYNRAEEFLNSHIDTATTMDEMVEKFKANRGFVKACWCGDPECEGEVKYQTGGVYSSMNSKYCLFFSACFEHMVEKKQDYVYN